MQSAAKTVDEYLSELPDDQGAVVSAVRDVVLANLPEGYEETMRWGMISYEIPLARYPETYNGQPLSYAGLASQKRHFALYLNADGTEESTVQVHRDAENMAFHMDLIADHVQQARDYLDFSKMNIQIYGTPTEDVVEQMRQLAGSGVPVTIKTPVTGFDRIG